MNQSPWGKVIYQVLSAFSGKHPNTVFKDDGGGKRLDRTP